MFRAEFLLKWQYVLLNWQSEAIMYNHVQSRMFIVKMTKWNCWIDNMILFNWKSDVIMYNHVQSRMFVEMTICIVELTVGSNHVQPCSEQNVYCWYDNMKLLNWQYDIVELTIGSNHVQPCSEQNVCWNNNMYCWTVSRKQSCTNMFRAECLLLIWQY